MIFRQLFDNESFTYTYLIADQQAKKAILVDPVITQVERDLRLLAEFDLTLSHTLETHIHADHITGAHALRQQTNCKIIVPANATEIHGEDKKIQHAEVLKLGHINITALATPGHTDDSMIYVVNKHCVLTGDTLFVRGCGRTDFQHGDPGQLYDSIQMHLFSLPDDTLVYPGHDYNGHTHSTVGEEKQWNPRLAERTREEFISIMENLNLPTPKKIKESVPANRYCGNLDVVP